MLEAKPLKHKVRYYGKAHKINVFMFGIYVHSTHYYKTCADAKQEVINRLVKGKLMTNKPITDNREITARFDTEYNRRNK